MNKIKQQYIEFAENNGFDFHKWVSEKENFNLWTKDFFLYFYETTINLISKKNNTILFSVNITELITSKPFIESIARGMTKNWCQTEDWDIVFNDKVKWLIVHQAKAIAEFGGDTLEDFIINLDIGTENN